MVRVFLLLALGCGSEQGFDPRPPQRPRSLGALDVAVAPPVIAAAGPDATVPAVPEVSPPVPPAACPLVPDPQRAAACDPGTAAFSGAMPHGTVQAAIDATAVGGDVWVCPGWWTEALFLDGGKHLLAVDPTPGATTLVGTQVGSPVVLAASASLQGFGIVGGQADAGAGVFAVGDLDLTCVVFEDNAAERGDGGAVSVQGTLRARYATFRRNEASGAGGAVRAAAVELSDAVFDDNVAADGGAVSAGTLRVERATFSGNRAGRGGAWALHGFVAGLAQANDLVFDGNEADAGGAIHVAPYAAFGLVFERTTFSDNQGGRGAGAVDLASDWPVDAVFEDASFVANGGGESGAVAASGWMSPGGRVRLSRVHFLDNVGAGAGALAASPTTGRIHVDATSLRVWRNEGPRGAVGVERDDTFTCDGCDFGTAENDNHPSDASVGDAAEGALGAAFSL